jgi:hypothetical protein
MDTEKKQNRDWSMFSRHLWWLKYAAVVAALWGVNRAFNEWIYTRASIAYVDQQIETRESKDSAIETKLSIKENAKVLNNVRDNLLILMDRQSVKSRPMPSRINDNE